MKRRKRRQLVSNPAVSEAQRRYLNASFGHAWVKEHGLDNRGKLPERVANSSPLAVDPSRTVTLRRALVAELRKRYTKLKVAMMRFVLRENAFGLVTNLDWSDETSPKKVKAFKAWLREQTDLAGLSDEDLWRKYAEAGFKKGLARSHDDVRGVAKGQDKLEFYAGTRKEFLDNSFRTPVATEKVELLAGRSYDDMEGVNDAMSLRMSRTLTDGLVQGESPRTVALALAKDCDVSAARAETIARTEIVRAHADGQLEALDRLGVGAVGVQAEQSTAGDSKVCEECSAHDGDVLSLEDAQGIIPMHPNCRCAWVPNTDGVDAATLARNYNPDQSRDAHGRWGGGWETAPSAQAPGYSDTKRKDCWTKDEHEEFKRLDKECRRVQGLNRDGKATKEDMDSKESAIARLKELRKGADKKLFDGGTAEHVSKTQTQTKSSDPNAGRFTGGFEKTVGVSSVVAHKDFSSNGARVVTLDNGEQHHVYYDKDSGMYFHSGAGQKFIGSDKMSALKNLVDGAKRGEFQAQGVEAVKTGTTFERGKPVSVDDIRQHVRETVARGGYVGDALKVVLMTVGTPTGDVREHGMSNAEKFNEITVAHPGGEIHLQYSPKFISSASDTLRDLAHPSIPGELMSNIGKVVLSTQRNKNDDYWAKEYGRSFTSAATGGDGNIVAYNGGGLDYGVIAHEAGHNLATNTWGSTKPPEKSDFGKCQKMASDGKHVENGVTAYGKENRDEDFAESCKLYTESREAFAKDHPEKHAALKKMLGE